MITTRRVLNAADENNIQYLYMHNRLIFVHETLAVNLQKLTKNTFEIQMLLLNM